MLERIAVLISSIDCKLSFDSNLFIQSTTDGKPTGSRAENPLTVPHRVSATQTDLYMIDTDRFHGDTDRFHGDTDKNMAETDMDIVDTDMDNIVTGQTLFIRTLIRGIRTKYGL